MTNYPAQIDTSISLPSATDNLTPVSGVVFNRLRNAILAVEIELGVQPSGVYSNVASRLGILESGLGNLQLISLSGDLGNTLGNPYVIGIQGRPISSSAPNLGDTLAWNGIAWVPSAVPGSSILAGGDLGGVYPNPTVIKLQGKTLGTSLASIGASQDGYQLTWVNSASEWRAIKDAAAFVAGGDLTGTVTSQQVVSLTGSGGNINSPALTITSGGDISAIGGVNIKRAGVNNLLLAPYGLSAGAIWGGANAVTPSFTNYALYAGGGTTLMNVDATGSLYFRVANVDTMTMDVNGLMMADSKYISLGTTAPSLTGDIRGTKTFSIKARRADNLADVPFASLDGGNNARFESIANTTIYGSTEVDILAPSGIIAIEASDAVYIDGYTHYLRDAAHNAVLTITNSSGITFTTATTAPSVKFYQADLITASGTGATTIIQAQNATGLTSIGGNLVLQGGSGTSSGGSAAIYSGTSVGSGFVSSLSIAPTSIIMSLAAGNSIQFSNTLMHNISISQIDFVGAPTINQQDIATASATGGTFTIHAQNATGTTSTGGSLSLTGGTGTSAYGTVNVNSPMAPGYLAYTFATDANQTLTPAQSAVNMLVINAGIISVARTITLSRLAANKSFILVRNNNAQTVNIGFASGTTVAVATNTSAWITTDGTNAITMMTGT